MQQDEVVGGKARSPRPTIFARAPTLKLSIPKVHPVQNTATGISALSIWMKDTDRYRYAAFPSHNVPAPWPPQHLPQIQLTDAACQIAVQ